MQGIDFDRMAERIRNWGRWGPDDNRGTLNLIGPEALKRGVAAARDGKQFSLGLRFDRNGPQDGFVRTNPQLFLHTLDQAVDPQTPRIRYADDSVFMTLQCATQWDALSHVHYDGELYNGCKVCDTLTPRGATRLGVEHLANPGITSRGILLDVAGFLGVPVLDAGYDITPDVLAAVVARQGVRLEPGDILAVRTGAIAAMVAGDRDRYKAVQPGLAPECAEWLHDHQAAAVCADNIAVERLGGTRERGEVMLPLHGLCLRDMGMPLGEMFNLEALAQDCAADGRYEFLICAPPLGFTGAVGSPVNPIVLK